MADSPRLSERFLPLPSEPGECVDDDFLEDLRRATGAPVSHAVVRDVEDEPAAVRIRIGSVEGLIEAGTPWEVQVQALRLFDAWAAAEGSGRRVVQLREGPALLTDEELAALPPALAKLRTVRIEHTVARTAAAAAQLAAIGVNPRLSVASLQAVRLDEVKDARDVAAAVLCASKWAVFLGDYTPVICRRLTALAAKAGGAAPSIRLDLAADRTVIAYADATETLWETPYLGDRFYEVINRWLAAHGYPLRFVLVRPPGSEKGHALLVPPKMVPDLVRVAGLAPVGAEVETAAGGGAPPVFENTFGGLPTIEELVGPERCVVMDAERVDTADGYVAVVDELLALAGTQARVECVEGARRILTLELGGAVFRAELNGDTDWVDARPLLACLNEALAHVGAEGRLVQVREPGWGQEIGFAYADAVQARMLDDFGLAVRPGEE